MTSSIVFVAQFRPSRAADKQEGSMARSNPTEPNQAATGAAITLTAEDRDVIARMGLDPEKFLAQKKADREEEVRRQAEMQAAR